MFHCNGWTYTWAVTAVGGTHVCLRKVDPAVIFPLIEQARRHPPVRRADRAQHAGPRAGRGEAAASAATIEVATGGAAPPSAVIEAMEGMGFRVTHLYGLTESYGPGHRLRRAAGLAGAAADRARRADGAPGRALPDPGRLHGRGSRDASSRCRATARRSAR